MSTLCAFSFNLRFRSSCGLLQSIQYHTMACCSSFHGHISEIPNISVDNFTNKDVDAYFLSHTHTDHTEGLYKYDFNDILRRNNAWIYMSETSRAIVEHELKCRLGRPENWTEIVGRIKPLNVGTTPVTLPADPERGLKETHMLVTLIPAGHSFGSAMLLFYANSRTVLYTGDFRMSVNDVSKLAQLHDKNGSPIHIDGLYVDTTFIHRKYAHFPKRSDSVAAALYEIERWLDKDGNNRVAIQTSAKYGYEYVFNKLYEKLGCKVHVEKDRWEGLYSNLPQSVPGVTNEKSRIHLCWKMRRNHISCIDFEPVENLNFLHIHLSAQKWANFEPEDNPIDKISDNEIDVCFSTHCSRTELLYFVNYFNPTKVVGFPNNYDVGSTVKIYDDVYSYSPKRAKKTEDGKMEKHVIRKIFDL